MVGITYGGLAQLARASALHAEGRRFDSDILHTKKREIKMRALFSLTVIEVISTVKIYHEQGHNNANKIASIAFVAQLVEQLICNQQVTGSIPADGSYFILSARLVVGRV